MSEKFPGPLIKVAAPLAKFLLVPVASLASAYAIDGAIKKMH